MDICNNFLYKITTLMTVLFNMYGVEKPHTFYKHSMELPPPPDGVEFNKLLLEY